MSKKSKDLLLASDKKFLEYQLTQNNFKYIFLNGGTVVKQVKNLGILKLETIDKIRFNKNGVMSEIVRGSLGAKTYIGWGLNAGYGATFKGGLEDLSNWLSKNLEKIN